MVEFLKKETDGVKFELLIDAKLFPKNIVFKAAYNFLDRGYFFFRLDADENIILQLSPKEGIKTPTEQVIGDFSDELLNVSLRDTLERENKTIRETIVSAAIGNSLDAKNFVSIDTDRQNG